MTMTRSERAFDLLDRLLKATEPGGFYHLPSSFTDTDDGDQIERQREDFIAEVMGVVTSKTPGEVPIESRLNTAQLALRSITAEIKRETIETVIDVVKRDFPGAFKRIVESSAIAMEIAALALHVTGVPDNLIGVEPSEAEIKEDEKRGCNCTRCQQLRMRKEEAKKKSG